MKKISFVECSSGVPIIKFVLSDGTEGYALVDTGSDPTMFDKNFILQHKKSFRLVDGAGITMIGLYAEDKNLDKHITTTITVGDIKIDIPDGMIVDLSIVHDAIKTADDNPVRIAAIIGCDTLLQYGVSVDFDKKVIKIK